jgi:hypothetical protein
MRMFHVQAVSPSRRYGSARHALGGRMSQGRACGRQLGPAQPRVFVGVEGGLADYTAFGPVRVALVDWDAIRDACDDEEALERIGESREEIAALPDGDFKAGLVAALDELERRHGGEPEQTALETAAE